MEHSPMKNNLLNSLMGDLSTIAELLEQYRVIQTPELLDEAAQKFTHLARNQDFTPELQPLRQAGLALMHGRFIEKLQRPPLETLLHRFRQVHPRLARPFQETLDWLDAMYPLILQDKNVGVADLLLKERNAWLTRPHIHHAEQAEMILLLGNLLAARYDQVHALRNFRTALDHLE
jgi:hypothetical protein